MLLKLLSASAAASGGVLLCAAIVSGHYGWLTYEDNLALGACGLAGMTAGVLLAVWVDIWEGRSSRRGQR